MLFSRCCYVLVYAWAHHTIGSLCGKKKTKFRAEMTIDIVSTLFVLFSFEYWRRCGRSSGFPCTTIDSRRWGARLSKGSNVQPDLRSDQTNRMEASEIICNTLSWSNHPIRRWHLTFSLCLIASSEERQTWSGFTSYDYSIGPSDGGLSVPIKIAGVQSRLSWHRLLCLLSSRKRQRRFIQSTDHC